MEIKLDNEMKLVVKISNSEPIELVDFAKSMMSLASDYRNRQTANPNQPATLYIKEIKSGSIITELAPLAATVPLLIEHFDQIQNYAEYLHGLIGWLLGKENKPDEVNTKQLNNVVNIVSPIVSDAGSQINIGAINAEGNSVINININHSEAHVIQNNAKRAIAQLQEQEKTVEMGDYPQVIMYWEQAAPHKDTDQAMIEAIWPKPVKVIMPEKIKEEMLLSEPHPFSKGYLVDVNVQTIQGKPKLYKIINYYDTVDKD